MNSIQENLSTIRELITNYIDRPTEDLNIYTRLMHIENDLLDLALIISAQLERENEATTRLSD